MPTWVDNLIYDRDEDDLATAKRILASKWSALSAADKALYTAGLKGSYNAADLNRVESAVNAMKALLLADETELANYRNARTVAIQPSTIFPFTASTYQGLTVKTTWAASEIPTSSELARYISNVQTIKNAMAITNENLPSSMQKLGIDGANAIEEVLYDLYNAVTAGLASLKAVTDNIAASFVYSGQAAAGMIWEGF